MAELILARDERLRLKAQSHHLDPTVLLGASGLSEAVVKEIDRAFNAHGLIKVRLPASPRAQREQLFAEVAGRLAAARIQLIGRLMVLYRPVPVEPRARARPSAKGTQRQRAPTGAGNLRQRASTAAGAKRPRPASPPARRAGRPQGANAPRSAKKPGASARPRRPINLDAPPRRGAGKAPQAAPRARRPSPAPSRRRS